jgi:ABC-type microcin C transport system permease subunit YejB
MAFSGIFTFLVDAYPQFAASALAANSFARSSFAGVFPLFGIQSKSLCNLPYNTPAGAFLWPTGLTYIYQ